MSKKLPWSIHCSGMSGTAHQYTENHGEAIVAQMRWNAVCPGKHTLKHHGIVWASEGSSE